MTAEALDRWSTGYQPPRLVRTMTAERMRWYADALETVSAGASAPVPAGPNIHTDDALARANGLPARVADGMVSTNWIHSALAAIYGTHFLEGGSLRTRYVRPIFVDERIEVTVRVTTREADARGEEQIVCEVQCVKADGQVATGGVATIPVPTE